MKYRFFKRNGQFYYEPEGYKGSEPWSEGYSSELIAAEAARLERECRSYDKTM